MLLGAALAAVFALRITSFEPDELGYTRLAIGIAHALTPFTSSYGGSSRLNQLYPLLISPLWGLFGNVTAFHLTHAWNTLLMASAAIPAYLLTREVVQVRWASYAAALFVVLLPWQTLATAELTEVAAYPAAVWAFLAMQRALGDPSPRRDVIALVAIAVATYGRLQLILLAPAFVVAMLVHELGYGCAPRKRGQASRREVVRRLARRHAVLSAAGVLGLVIGVPLLISGTLASAAGFYGNTLSGVSLGGPTFDLARSYVTALALGMGAIPVALALGFALSAFAAPVSRRVHAFASLMAVVVVAMAVQVAEISVRFTGAALQERYLFYVAPLFLVGMFAALLANRYPVRTVIAGSVGVGLLIATTHFEIPRTPFWYQVSPGLTSFYDWVLPVFGSSSPGALRIAGVVVAGIGVLFALLLVRIGPTRALVVAASAALAFCGAETTHAMSRVLHGTTGATGLGGGTLRDVSWIDRHVPAGALVYQVVDEAGGRDPASLLWNGNAFWNRSVNGAYASQFIPLKSYFTSRHLAVDSRSGAISATRGGFRGPQSPGRPRYAVVMSRGFPMLLAGNVVAHSPGNELELVRLASPMRVDYLFSGLSPDGWVPVESPVTLSIYSLGGAAGRCADVSFTFSVSDQVPDGETLTSTVGGSVHRVPVIPGRDLALMRRVCGRATGVPQVRIGLDEPVTAAAVAVVTPQLRSVEVRPR